MPMQLTVTRNRKTSENYNSEGYGVSLTVELDQSLLSKPRDLQQQIDQLYREADNALDHQVEQPGNGRPSNGNGNGNGNSHRSNGANATASQRKAIDAIANTLDIDPVQEARHEFGFDLDRLTVKEASQLIDHLKALQTSGRSNGGRR